uniref:Uncharacterized protein n=1 Tax=Acrobeloides nanus TaxID=290746 RepID=A0A914DMY9_9BILA
MVRYPLKGQDVAQIKVVSDEKTIIYDECERLILIYKEHRSELGLGTYSKSHVVITFVICSTCKIISSQTGIELGSYLLF